MKKRPVVWLIIGLTILVIGVCGCMKKQTDDQSNNESKVTLSERQKNILAEQGLPTEYDALPAHQQRAIVAIEEMLSYAEDKYDMAFSYAGYAEAGPMEEEHMRAYPSSGHMAVDSFTITKTENGYEDDYIRVAAVPCFTEYLTGQLKAFLPEVEIQVYGKITKTTLAEIPTAETDFDGKVSSSLCVFVDGATCTPEEFETFKAQYADFMQEHQLYGMAEVVLLKEGKLVYLSRYNYTDYLSEEVCYSRDTVSVQR